MSGEWSKRRRIWPIVLALLLVAFAVVLLRTTWVCDDAFITLRTIDNLVHGYGLRWNVDERVQSFTHPLWMLLVAAVYFFTREAFYTVSALSLLISLVLRKAAQEWASFRHKLAYAPCLRPDRVVRTPPRRQTSSVSSYRAGKIGRMQGRYVGLPRRERAN